MSFVGNISNELLTDWDIFKQTWHHVLELDDDDFKHFDRIITGKIWCNAEYMNNIKTD